MFVLCAFSNHYSYLQMGSPKVWYGVPASASLCFEVAMRDALPHLFEDDPLLLHRLVTMLSPSELRARGVPVHRWVVGRV
jgi:histone demethylase JARID1